MIKTNKYYKTRFHAFAPVTDLRLPRSFECAKAALRAWLATHSPPGIDPDEIAPTQLCGGLYPIGRI